MRNTLRIPPQLAWFEGHFPGQPILPGIVQLKWAIDAAQEIVGHGAQPVAIHQLKLKSPILPGDCVELTLTGTPDGAVVNFNYRSSTTEHSSGRLLYRAP